jgi:hypothetical protein
MNYRTALRLGAIFEQALVLQAQAIENRQGAGIFQAIPPFTTPALAGNNSGAFQYIQMNGNDGLGHLENVDQAVNRLHATDLKGFNNFQTLGMSQDFKSDRHPRHEVHGETMRLGFGGFWVTTPTQLFGGFLCIHCSEKIAKTKRFVNIPKIDVNGGCWPA